MSSTCQYNSPDQAKKLWTDRCDGIVSARILISRPSTRIRLNLPILHFEYFMRVVVLDIDIERHLDIDIPVVNTGWPSELQSKHSSRQLH